MGRKSSYSDETRRREDVDGSSYVDMRIDFELDGKILLAVGGRWNLRMREYEGDADSAQSRVVVRIHPGQEEATRWYAGWLAVHKHRRNEPLPPPTDLEADEIDTDPSCVYSALMAGGRRGGKTWWAAAAVAAYAVEFPNAITWALSPSRGRDDTKADEIRRYMKDLLAPEWIQRQTVATGWEMVNGSVIMLKSAHVGADPDAIKEGQADLIWMNEAQKMVKRVYVVARGAVSDKSGLVLCCANPPVEAKDQQWVSDFAADTDAKRRASVHINFNPLNNPHVDRRALLSIGAEVDDRTFQIEVLGMFMPAIDSVAYNWLRKENEKATPSPIFVDGNSNRQIPCPRTGLVDVTTEFLENEELGEGITQLIGLDVQRHPYIGGPIYKFFAKPEQVPRRDNVLAWIVDEAVLEGGDEAEWCHTLDQGGHSRATSLIVCDASGKWQHSRRTSAEAPPPEWEGLGSFDIIMGCGFRRIVSPNPRNTGKNPGIQDRVRAFTSMISNRFGVRRLFADRDRAPKTCRAIREWKVVNGKPSRSQDVAHLGDGISYPLIRLFPRILRSDNPGPMEDVKQRVDRPDPETASAARDVRRPRAARRNRGL